MVFNYPVRKVSAVTSRAASDGRQYGKRPTHIGVNLIQLLVLMILVSFYP